MESTAMQPASFDVLITDISEADLAHLGRDHFGFERLSLASPADAHFPARGVIYGVNRRVFVPLTVRHSSGEPIRVFFLIDTGAPSTFLREDTLQAIGFVDAVPSSPNVFINGIKISVGISHGHFSNVDLLGADFLFRTGAILTVNYSALECLLNVSTATGGGA
jgi:hypothetical protein